MAAQSASNLERLQSDIAAVDVGRASFETFADEVIAFLAESGLLDSSTPKHVVAARTVDAEAIFDKPAVRLDCFAKFMARYQD